jgi:hypothetical protein
MFISPEKPFLPPNYAKAMACASPTTRPTCELCRLYLGNARILNFLDISATKDFSFPLDSSASHNEGIIGSCLSSPKSSSVSSGVSLDQSSGSKRYSSMSGCCNEDSMTLSI